MSQLERLSFIDAQIKKRGGVTLKEVAERFEVTERQARRDIDYLVDRLGAPIEWIASSRRYEYADMWDGLDFANEKALLFLVFARAAAGTLAYVPLAEEGALAKLLELVPVSLRKAESSIRYELPGMEPADIERLGLIVRAIADGRSLDIVYRDAEGKDSERRIEPARLVNYDGAWYCVAFDQARSEIRTFRLSRMASLTVPPEKANSVVDEAKIEVFLESSFGMFKGSGSLRAVARFYGKARAIVEDEVWHPSQVRGEGVDPERGDYVELSVPVSRYDEILGRVLRFGSNAEAVAPATFRVLWKEEIGRMAASIAAPPRRE